LRAGTVRRRCATALRGLARQVAPAQGEPQRFFELVLRPAVRPLFVLLLLAPGRFDAPFAALFVLFARPFATALPLLLRPLSEALRFEDALARPRVAARGPSSSPAARRVRPRPTTAAGRPTAM